MSKPAVLAMRAISTPRTSRTVIEATTSLRASFSLTLLRAMSLAFTDISPLCPVRQLDREHDVAQAFAVNVLRQRNGNAAAERIFDHEIEGFEIAQRIALHRPLGDMLESFRNTLRRQLALDEIPILGVVANHRNVRSIAFVAGARMREIVNADAHNVPSTT